jgi:hypothetical protein
MKKALSILAIAAIFTACNRTPQANQNSNAALGVSDTSGFAEFRNYKQQQRIIEQQRAFETEGIYDGTNSFASNSSNNSGVKERIVYVTKPAPASSTRRSTARRTNRTSSRSGSNNGYYGNNGSVAQAPVPARKKGWSHAAKGTAIGAGSGAVLGAIISKKKGKGAIIGGVLGAAGGYVIGRAKDKREGRY